MASKHDVNSALSRLHNFIKFVEQGFDASSDEASEIIKSAKSAFEIVDHELNSKFCEQESPKEKLK